MFFKKKPNVGSKLEELLKRNKKNTLSEISHARTSQLSNTTKQQEINNNFSKKPTYVNSIDKTELLIHEIQKLKNQIIVPSIDFEVGQVVYPFLSTIGESDYNIEFLENLTENGFLEKHLFEKIAVCPIHKNSMGNTIHLYCPSCNSNDVEKLNLFEHKKCGYIADSNKFKFSEGVINNCPSCKKEIKNFEREIRVPAMWYQCNSCHEKFDNVVINLYCRKHDHDFEINTARVLSTYYYSIRYNETNESSNLTNIIKTLESELSNSDLDIRQNFAISGNSENIHKIPIYVENKLNKKSVLIFNKNKTEIIDESDLNSILVIRLDVGQRNIVLVTNNSVTENAFRIARSYGVKILSNPDNGILISELAEFIAKKIDEN